MKTKIARAFRFLTVSKSSSASRRYFVRKLIARECWLLVILGWLVLETIAPSNVVAQQYSISRMGLFDDGEHSSYSSLHSLSELGHAAGSSGRGPREILGWSAWLYYRGLTSNIGLIDDEHTRGDGYRWSQPLNGTLSETSVSNNGAVVGSSKRYSENTGMGETVWMHRDGNTSNIGLTSGNYTRNDGFRFSGLVQMNQSGQVIGYSRNYWNGNSNVGHAWIYDQGSHTRLGFTDSEHSNVSGINTNTSASTAIQMSELGHVVGTSLRYSGAGGGHSAWLYHNGNHSKIGLTNSTHTSSLWRRESTPTQVNNAGQVVGVSTRYVPDSYVEAGSSAWLHSNGTTMQIGLYDSQHTAGNGNAHVRPIQLNESGHVIGRSRYYGQTGFDSGESTWLYYNGTTERIGFFDMNHTGPAGTGSENRQFSRVHGLNDLGQVIGISHLFGSVVTGGQTAWLHENGVTKNIGLTDALHTGQDGRLYSSPTGMAESGHIVGVSERHDGGQSAWIHYEGTTTQIGLFDGLHTAPNGYHSSGVSGVNELGHATGSSWQFDGGGGYGGETAWFHDSNTGITYDLGLSVDPLTNFGFSRVRFLREDGFVFGQYRLYDSSSQYLNRAFVFSIDIGLHDLGDWVNFTSSNGVSLSDVLSVNSNGDIVATSGSLLYMLSPTAVPEPGNTLALLGLALAVGLRRRRKNKN